MTDHREGREQRKVGCRQWPYPTAHGALARVCEHCHAADVADLNAREATIAALRHDPEGEVWHELRMKLDAGCAPGVRCS